MAEVIEVQAWVLVDADGSWVIAENADKLHERYTEQTRKFVSGIQEVRGSTPLTSTSRAPGTPWGSLNYQDCLAR